MTRTAHVVVHQHRHEGRLGIHECHARWTLSLPSATSQRGVVSLILTGSESRVLYGSDDPEITRRVDRLRRRIERGRCFAGGPLGLLLSGQQRKQHPDTGMLPLIVEEIERDLLDETVSARACSVRLRDAYVRPRNAPPVEWVVSGPSPSLWQRIIAAHQVGADEAHLRDELLPLAAELAMRSRPFESIAGADGPLRRLAMVIARRASVGGGGRRIGYRSARTLARALAADEILLTCSPRTILRRTSAPRSRSVA